MRLQKAGTAIIAAVAYLWIAGTALIVLVGSFFTFAEHSYLGLGLVQVQGALALVLGLCLGLGGLATTVLVWKKRREGTYAVAAFCLFFVLSFGGAVAKDLLASATPATAALENDLPMLIMIAGFILSALWAWNRGRPQN